MAMVHTGDVGLHVQRLPPTGGRPAIATAVLLHGLLTDSLASYYFTLAPAFAAAGVDVVMYDHRGHGRSERPATGYGLDTFVTDLEALLDRLELAGPVHLVGNSFGGTVAFGYAVRRPQRVAGLAVIESEPATVGWAHKLRGLLGRVEAELSENETEVLAWIAANRGPHTARLSRSAARLVRATTITREIPASRVLSEDRIRSVRCPVLAVYGAESDLAVQGMWLSSLLPDCRVRLVPRCEHSVLVEAPGVCRELILPWIEEHRAVTGAGAELR
ncbi:alpha/beta fold hydrolase [Wenjunlia tyrosinilytica]|uniref:Alpha/beta hydrolase n=1 Tax=Wenjunlia tyrosinilytica TaxID=1544741 RepID=A0A917ZHT1_9ACTN|nr:alpha/beta hydrolase [Wenjunlia tyrosinilytica]GGO82067.1 alpha/beta hydrolase [Wenjunlia tyrosinilytica]